MNTQEIPTLEDGEAWVKSQSLIWTKPGLVLLSGPMGAGKTQMAKWILGTLGFHDTASPTFAIHYQYETKLRTVDHFDLYRLGSDDELENVGFWEAMNQPDNLVLIEWADRLDESVYPTGRTRLWMELKTAPSRRVTWRFL